MVNEPEDEDFREAVTELRTRRRERALELRREGLSARAIATRLGVNHVTILNDLSGDESTNGGKPMTTPTTATEAPAGELATVLQRLAAAEAKAAKFEEQLAGQTGVQPAGTRDRGRMPVAQLRSGSMPEGAGEPEEVDGVKIAETILRRNGLGLW